MSTRKVKRHRTSDIKNREQRTTIKLNYRLGLVSKNYLGGGGGGGGLKLISET